MPDIKQLSQEVANQISAGEVVERPASVVKELVENSIDADSDRILIKIKNGGKKLIRVKDNGIGIEEENIEKAFSRYATSKIENISDLYSLNTLGFRGEALASISSVSKLTALSKAKDNIKGVKIIYHGGKKIKKETAACPEGTDIKVEDLFYNTPARYKYLKTKTTEFGHISKIITQESLSYPDIKFNLKHNGKNVLSTPGSGKLKDAIYAIYGDDIFSKLHFLEFEDRYIKIKGYIADPSLTRSSRIHEMFFVNKRSVYSRTLSNAVESAYRGLIAKNRYPIVFLFVKLNPILVDVNVHPAKKQIKFSRNKIIKSVVKNGIKEKLNDLNPAVQYKIKNNNSQNKKVNNNNNTKFNFTKENTSKSEITRDKDGKNNGKKFKSKKRYDYNKEKYKENDKDNVKENDKDNNIKNANKKPIKSNKTNNFNIKEIYGQIFYSYILVEVEDNLYIIDQHNAHERILYDNFYQKFKNNNNISQKLLTPVNLELTPAEVEILKNNEDKIKNLGFEFEYFGGNSILIQSMPEIISQKSIKNELREIIDKLINEKSINSGADLIDEMIEFMACRSAIKADEKINKKEMENIVVDLFESSNPFRCPHGRPILIKMSREDIDRGVGR
ncbi:MAG: DNA mismatch repair endonuclease MutL [Bacillota bacterium]